MNFMERIRANCPGQDRAGVDDVDVAAQSDLLVAVDLLSRCQIFNLWPPIASIAHAHIPEIKRSWRVALARSKLRSRLAPCPQNDRALDSRHVQSSLPRRLHFWTRIFLSRAILRSSR